MYDTLIYILFAVAIVIMGLVAYNLLCAILMILKQKKNGKLTEDYARRLSEEKPILNLWMLLANWRVRKKSKKSTSVAKNLKSTYRNVRILIFMASLNQICSAITLFILALALCQLSSGMQSVASSIQSIFGGDDDCICYAECTGNPSDDSKTAYELIFGEAEYEKLKDILKKSMTAEEFHIFEGFEDGLLTAKGEPDMQYVGEAFIRHMNEELVQQYTLTVNQAHYLKKFKALDGKDRSQMTRDELEKDLIAMMADYKINGRNPNCDSCKFASDILLDFKCRGIEHWKEGWKWSNIADEIEQSGGNPVEPTNPSGPSTNPMGGATGQYAVALDDGMYYWYHQDGGKACGCTYCGNWSDSRWGIAGNQSRLFGSDGCAVYALAIGLSNICGQEITPAVVFEDLQSPIVNYLITTNSTYFDCRNIKRDAVCKALAAKHNLTVSLVSHDTASIDAILNQGGIVWGSWVDAQCAWCSNGTSHFMCIRKTDGENYYCFTSCRGKCASSSGKAGAIQTMNYPINKQVCINSMTSGQLYGFVPQNSGGSGGETPTPVNGSVLDFTAGGNFECPFTKFYCSYMGWQMVTSKSSAQYKWRQKMFPDWVNDKNGIGSTKAFDSEGFGRAQNRYVIAVSSSADGGIGSVGQKLDIYLKDGTVLYCVVGDIKSSGDEKWTKWGHTNAAGQKATSMNTIEFIVDRTTWYTNGKGSHAGPGTSSCHPNFSSPVVKIVRGDIM